LFFTLFSYTTLFRSLRDRVAAERVRLDDVAAGREILMVNVGDDLGPRQVEQVEIAAHIAIVFRETVAPEVRLREPMALHHRPHRAIEEEDPFGEQRAQSYRGVRVHRSAFGHELTKSRRGLV